MEARAEPVAISVNREKPWQVLVSFKEGPAALLDLSKSATTDVPCVPTGQLPVTWESSQLIRLPSCIGFLAYQMILCGGHDTPQSCKPHEKGVAGGEEQLPSLGRICSGEGFCISAGVRLVAFAARWT
jgi:hypothetical protein